MTVQRSRSISEQELQQFPILAALNPAHLDKVLHRSTEVRVARGDHLFHQGDPAQWVYLCREGQLKLFRLAPSGQEKIIALIDPGRSFAEATMFMPQRRYPVHCAALAPSTLLAIDAETLVRILRTEPDVCFQVMATLSRRVHEKVGQIESLSLFNAHLRVAGYLFAEFHRQQQPRSFRLTASKKHIAGLLAIQPETFSRSLGQLQKDGIVTVNARTISVDRPDLLEQIARGQGQAVH